MADLTIERREYKYLVEREMLPLIRAALRPYCSLDKYGAGAADHRYMIESLYLDTPQLALWQCNAHEAVDRYKLRIRRYPQAPRSPIFLEVKRRVHDVIVKTRAQLKAGTDWAALLRDPFTPEKLLRQDPALERFFVCTHMIGAQPTELVRYMREAWVSDIDDYARITFDSEVESHRVPADQWSFDSSPSQWKALDCSRANDSMRSPFVLEVKFTSQVPLWLVAMIDNLGLTRRAFSKYGRAIDSRFEAQEIRIAATPAIDAIGARHPLPALTREALR